MVKPTVISTFAGGGGSSLGYHWAGFNELLAIDFDDNAIETLKANYPEMLIWKRDIKTVSAEEILNACKIKVGELDVLDGSPPCQGFSTAGKRKVSDPRNSLFKEYVRLIEGLQPRVFVMENVSGMAKGTMKGMFNLILQTLKDTGYNVKCKLMNAMWYEVPQSRERLIFIGVRKDLNAEPSFPEPLNRIITLRDALNDVINTDEDIRKAQYPINTKSHQLLIRMKSGEKGDKITGGSHFGLCRLKWDKPCRTILKEDGSGVSCSCCHPEDNRRLTISELKRCASFPDNYKLVGTYAKQWARLGNAVMPKMMYHIATNIKNNILSATAPK